MRIALTTAFCGIAAFAAVGCTVEEYREPGVAVEADAPVVEGPIYQGPGVEFVDVEPAPEERVYVYDPGYPPGAYFYGGYCWYGGYRYPRDVFINRVVNENIRERRYVDRDENRRYGERFVERDRREFVRTGGRRTHAQSGAGYGSGRPPYQTGPHPTVSPYVPGERRTYQPYEGNRGRVVRPEGQRVPSAAERREYRPQGETAHEPRVEHREGARPEDERPR